MGTAHPRIRDFRNFSLFWPTAELTPEQRNLKPFLIRLRIGQRRVDADSAAGHRHEAAEQRRPDHRGGDRRADRGAEANRVVAAVGEGEHELLRVPCL